MSAALERTGAVKKFHIKCGNHEGIVEAPTIGRAWRKLVGRKRTGFSRLARFKEVSGPNRHVWFYTTPQALDIKP